MIEVSLVGLLGRLTGTSVAACLLLAAALGIACARWLRVHRPAWLVLALLPLLAPLAFAALLLPPYAWDDVAYGAALPRDYANAGRFFYNADNGPYSAFPANYEALVTASLLLTGAVSAGQAVNVVCALALAAISVGLARNLGAPRAWSLLAGAFVLCAPALIRTAPLTKNDTVNALFQALAVWALISSAARPGFRAATLSGAFLGLSMGIKYSSLHFALAASPFIILFFLRTADSMAAGLKHAVAWVIALGICAAPWYVRNHLVFGNPFFPFFNETLGARNSFTPLHSAMLKESFDGLRDFSLRAGTPQTFVARVAEGFGVLPVLLVWPGAVLSLRSAHRGRALLVTGTIVIYIALTFFVGYWAPRYFLSSLVLASPLAILPLQRLSEGPWLRAPGARRALGFVLLAATSSIALLGALPPWRQHARRVTALLRDGREEFVRSHVARYEVVEWLNAKLTSGDRVAIGFNIQPFYYLRHSYYHIHPITEGDLVAAETPDQVEAALRQVGATVVAFSVDGVVAIENSPRISAYRRRLQDAQRELRRAGRLRPLATVGGVRLFRLADPSSHPREAPSPREAGADAR